MNTLDIATFADGGMIREKTFFEKIQAHDWRSYADKIVLVRGCGDIPIPPWAFMVIAARLAGVAKQVRYGNEHSNIIVSRLRDLGGASRDDSQAPPLDSESQKT